MKVLLTITILLLFICVSAKKIVVGSNQAITNVKKAISMAHDGDTIVVNAGVYKEGNIEIIKSLTIIGNGNPVMDGEHKYEIFTISGRNITVRGITFRNSGYSAMNDYASIKVVDAINVRI